ncbi:rcc01693 family protein [Pseudorhodobacter sp.]|uniref:rcc01693 family protein n=1 Tax=Pseudorhodobacter sp. TaxID=1934400 RepID=UPI002AFE2E0F|nr:rcc01693 family protein [Pseudorhodobacter sp.]
MTGIDWAALMQVGLHGLGMQPEAFWRLTPVELRIKLGVQPGAGPLTRTRLDELARAFPDVKKEPKIG